MQAKHPDTYIKVNLFLNVQYFLQLLICPVVLAEVVYTGDPSTQEAEIERFLSSKTYLV